MSEESVRTEWPGTGPSGALHNVGQALIFRPILGNRKQYGG